MSNTFECCSLTNSDRKKSDESSSKISKSSTSFWAIYNHFFRLLHPFQIAKYFPRESLIVLIRVLRVSRGGYTGRLLRSLLFSKHLLIRKSRLESYILYHGLSYIIHSLPSRNVWNWFIGIFSQTKQCMCFLWMNILYFTQSSIRYHQQLTIEIEQVKNHQYANQKNQIHGPTLFYIQLSPDFEE